jgi:hypothetical protein
MKKDFWVLALLVALATLAIVVVRQNQRMAEMKEQLALATAEKAKPRTVPPPKKELSEPVPEAAPPEPVTAPAPTPSTPPPASVSNAPSGAGGAVSNYFSSLAGMMKDPQMKEMIRIQQKMALDKMYGSLSRYLTLPADKLEALKELLADRQMALTEAGMSMMTGAGDRKQAAEEAKTVKTDYDKKIQDLLGPQDHEVFQDYEKTVGERMQLQMFKEALPADAALTEQQEDDLITAMYEERKTLPASSLMNNKTPDPSQLTEERIAEALKEIEQLQQRYAERAAAILSAAQLEQFTKWQQQWSTMQAAGLKMAAAMFGNRSAAKSAASK